MATFYLLPPRALLADHLADWLNRAMPGVDWDVSSRRHLVELVSVAAARPGLYLLHRDDLPVGEPAEQGLREAFGAEGGDEVVEVRMARPGEFVSRRWLIGQVAASA
jgi:hypothetical protein